MAQVNYLWDEIEDNVIEEYDDSGNTIVAYTTEPNLYGSVLTQDRGGELRIYNFDGQANTTELTDSSGNVTDTRRYSAFGEISSSTGTTVFSFQYCGQLGYQLDELASNLYVRLRFYRSSAARFLSSDPLVFPGHSQYPYANNSAVSGSDPSGALTITATKQRLSPGAFCGSPPNSESCIKWTWQMQNRGAKWPCGRNGGYIIQKIDFYCTMDNTCVNCPTAVPGTPTITFLEAIKVNANFKAAEDVANGFCIMHTCGKLKIAGELKFFCETQTGDISTNWKGRQTFREGSCTISGGTFTLGPIGNANPLPAWWAKPKNNEKPATRWFSLDWNCCDCSQSCESDASPKNPKGNTIKSGTPLPAGKVSLCQ